MLNRSLQGLLFKWDLVKSALENQWFFQTDRYTDNPGHRQISEPAELPFFFDKIQCQTGNVAFRCVSDTGRTGITREKQMPDQQDLPGQGG